MTQPFKRIGPWTALIMLIRLGARRLRQQPLDTVRGSAKTALSFLAFPLFLAFLLIYFYFLIHVLPFLGAATDRLSSAKLRSDAAPLIENLIPRFFTIPEALPLDWAQVQAGNTLDLALAILGVLIIFVIAAFIFITIVGRLNARQAALLQEFELQSVAKVAGPATAAARSRRL